MRYIIIVIISILMITLPVMALEITTNELNAIQAYIQSNRIYTSQVEFKATFYSNDAYVRAQRAIQLELEHKKDLNKAYWRAGGAGLTGVIIFVVAWVLSAEYNDNRD